MDFLKKTVCVALQRDSGSTPAALVKEGREHRCVFSWLRAAYLCGSLSLEVTSISHKSVVTENGKQPGGARCCYVERMEESIV